MMLVDRLQLWELSGAWIVARREIRDQLRDWRILTPIILLTLFFPLLMNYTARQAIDFVGRYGADIVGERLIPFLLMVVGFFPISISLVIALESFAGERERRSLEPLLATPLSDRQLYLGKMIASVVPPLAAAYLGISVYLSGLVISVNWSPPFVLLIQILALTTFQAIVMVAGAVVISSQTTSVRAANLLASFIIIPMAELIIAESMVMFWGRYNVLWWILLTLVLIAFALGRMGLRLFNREELLGREFDSVDFRWMLRRFAQEFVGGARNLRLWYQGLLTKTLRDLRAPILITAVLLMAGYAVGFDLARTFTIPAGILQMDKLSEGLAEQLGAFGMFTGRGMVWILWNNIRALGLATLLGAFTLGVLGQILLMTPIGITGYFAGNLSLAGQDSLRYITALVLPHATLEIPAAIITGAAILHLGLAALSISKDTSLGEGVIIALATWARVSLGLVLPLLIGAAAIEIFVTPYFAIWLLSG
jgi:ABC-type transport system involved in multi-copper enzyme maturation permease subunit